MIQLLLIKDIIDHWRNENENENENGHDIDNDYLH